MKAEARLAIAMFAVDPIGLGGVWFKRVGPERDVIADALRESLPDVRRLPLSIDDDRLLGGLDLVASLSAGGPIRQPGLIEQCRGGVLLVDGAERMRPALAGAVAQAMDSGGPGLMLLDEGNEGEAPPTALTDRLAFHLSEGSETGAIEGADEPMSDDALIAALGGLAGALGVTSERAPLFALRAARAHAAVKGRGMVTGRDLAVAARLVLAPRATRLPVGSQPQDQPPESAERQARDQPQSLDEIVLDAVRPALPPELLAEAAAGRGVRRSPSSHGQGARIKARLRGRPIGERAGLPRSGLRLALIETLRAAAPWQGLRTRGAGPVALRRDDFRVRSYQDRQTMLTVLAVDASGSAAFARMAEAKGAVELLLERAYAKRAEVALIAFRGAGAELLLPPTRSLTRARRLLAELPGGGATPLAAGLDAARELAEAARARGRTPQLIVLTDGRGNVSRDGRQSRSEGQADAQAAARRIAAAGLSATVIDIGARPQPEARALADAMQARALHLPRADASAMAALAA